VPRLQNGRQAELEDIGSRVAALAGEWDLRGHGLAAAVRRQIESLVAAEHWRRGLPARLLGLLRSQWRLWRGLRAVRRQATNTGIPAQELAQLLQLARTAHRLSLQLAHFEELRGLLSGWRWLHRWLALLLVLLTAMHVLTALRYGQVDWSVLLRLWPGGAQ
jgi:cytochrome b561